jgi:hypothetical protein
MLMGSMMERLGGWSSLELKRLCHAGRFSLSRVLRAA